MASMSSCARRPLTCVFEFAQYAPELAQSDMNAVLDEAAGIIDRLENVKRKKTTIEES